MSVAIAVCWLHVQRSGVFANIAPSVQDIRPDVNAMRAGACEKMTCATGYQNPGRVIRYVAMNYLGSYAQEWNFASPM